MTNLPQETPAPHSLGASIGHLRAKWGWIAGLGVALAVTVGVLVGVAELPHTEAAPCEAKA